MKPETLLRPRSDSSVAVSKNITNQKIETKVSKRSKHVLDLTSSLNSTSSDTSSVPFKSKLAANINFESTYANFAKQILNLQKNISIEFRNIILLEQAMTHKSYSNEAKRKEQNIAHNEKLEFLGDAVLDLAISELLLEKFPNDNEGKLSKKRASLVNEEVLSQLARELKLGECLRMGRGEDLSGGRSKDRLLACAYEALVGAIFSEFSYPKTKEFLSLSFTKVMNDLNLLCDFEKDFKTRLQESTQERFASIPEYILANELGPSHQREFFIDLYLSGKWISRGLGKSKKIAEQEAAKLALEVLK